MTIFGNIDFSPYCACMIIKKGLQTKFPHMGKIVNFFYVIYIPWKNLMQSIVFIKKTSEKIYYTRTISIFLL